MKKMLTILLAVAVLLSFAACGNNDGNGGSFTSDTKTESTSTTKSNAQSTTEKDDNKPEKYDYGSIPNTMTSADGKYRLAFVTDLGQLLDKSFNQGTWEGIKRFAKENGKSYKYYQPANGNQATDEDRYNSMKAAVDAGAEVVVCAGYLQGEALRKIAGEFPKIKFIFIDGIIADNAQADSATAENVASIDFNEEQSGFLAGYAAVADGYTRLGFTGGGGGTNPSCNRFAYGYVQGAEAAAKQMNKTVELKLSWEYGASFSPSAELQTMLNGWYANGTQIIFCCGGPMCQSAFAAASANEGAVIGSDVDQSSESDTVVTSAMKGLREAVLFALDKAYNDGWDEIAGKLTTLGAKFEAVGLPTESWSMEQFTLEAYEKLFNDLKQDKIKVDRDYEKLLPENFEAVKLEIV